MKKMLCLIAFPLLLFQRLFLKFFGQKKSICRGGLVGFQKHLLQISFFC